VALTSAIVPVEVLILECALIPANDILGKRRSLQIDFVKTEGVCRLGKLTLVVVA